MNYESIERTESLNEMGLAIESSAESISDSVDFTDNLEFGQEDREFENFESSQLEYSEIVCDTEVKENIADFLESYDDIKYENWSKLTLEEKEAVLQTAENWIANIEHRPAKSVQLEHMPQPGVMGYQNEALNKIALNIDVVGHEGVESYRKTIETLVHEGRHAYQRYNVEVCTIHESGAEVQSWRENFYDPKFSYYQAQGQKIYIPTKEGYETMDDYRLYYYQPVEIDARNFASDVMSRLEARGIVQPVRYA